MSETAESKRQARTRDLSKMPTNFEYLIGKADVCQLVQMSERTLQSMMSSGEFPPPDTYIGTMPRWMIGTFNDWLRKRCARKEK